jgi:ATP-dependent Lon protease
MDFKNINKEMIVVPLTKTVLFPQSNAQIRLNPELAQKLEEEIQNGNKTAVALSAKESSDPANLDTDKLYKTGTLICLDSVASRQGQEVLFAKVDSRVKVQSLRKEKNIIYAEIDEAPDIIDIDHPGQVQMLDYIKKVSYEISDLFKGGEEYKKEIEKIDSIPEIIGYLMPFIPVSIEKKQGVLETDSLKNRGISFMDILLQHKESISLQVEMAHKFSDQANKNYRKAFLKEQLRNIQEELNEDTPQSGDKKDYAQLIKDADMPEDVEKAAFEELEKLNQQGQGSHETNIIRNYLDLLVALPWKITEEKDIDINEAAKLLDAHHYGQDKIKERIIQHLSVMKLKKEKHGSILLLVGPPGTGKTSLGKGIAQALEREYVRISLGGVRDEAEIRGHRRTYIGALPGRLIQGMKKAGTKNPVFVLDEIDKLTSSFNGDPSSALLEVLDPEQNNTFSDHYLEVPYDLSDVFFVATANNKQSIPAPLLDRMEVIELSGYSANEKFHIGKDYIMESVLEEHGIKDDQLKINDNSLKVIIEKYTLEAGVRALRNQLAKVARFASRKIVAGDTELPFLVKEEMLEEILGNPVIRHDVAQDENPPGVVTGLAWTPVGGEILFIEATHMPGTGKLTLTGQLGDVMKESATISLSLFRSRFAFALPDFEFNKKDIHIHVPAGAMPKDGPSAGVVMFSAITSLIMGRKISPKLAMTGEITLRGRILPVGGIKEKVLAAHRAGIKKVLLPEENEKDLKDIPEEVKNEMRFKTINTVEDLIKETMGIELPKPEALMVGTIPEEIIFDNETIEA